jgi:predicted DCC family thiol-disulfide oxidoreductase YuxK
VTPHLLYDADCGFCTRVSRLIPLFRLPVQVSSIQSVDLVALGVSPDRARVEMPLVRADGSVAYGHQAVAGALATGALPLRLIARLMSLPPFDRVFKRAYSLLARHRHQLPGGTAACVLPAQGTSESLR